jgi:hypothetical protein
MNFIWVCRNVMCIDYCNTLVRQCATPLYKHKKIVGYSMKLKEVVLRPPHFAYRRITIMLINYKRVYRLWKHEGLSLTSQPQTPYQCNR